MLPKMNFLIVLGSIESLRARNRDSFNANVHLILVPVLPISFISFHFLYFFVFFCFILPLNKCFINFSTLDDSMIIDCVCVCEWVYPPNINVCFIFLCCCFLIKFLIILTIKMCVCVCFVFTSDINKSNDKWREMLCFPFWSGCCCCFHVQIANTKHEKKKLKTKRWSFVANVSLFGNVDIESRVEIICLVCQWKKPWHFIIYQRNTLTATYSYANSLFMCIVFFYLFF